MAEFLLRAPHELWAIVKALIIVIAPIYVSYRFKESQRTQKKPGSKVRHHDRTSSTED